MASNLARGLVGLVALGAAVLLVTGCEDDGLGVLRTCTLIGCDSGVIVDLGDTAGAASGDLEVELCVDDECTRQSVDPERGVASLSREPERWAPDEQVRVTVRVTDAAGTLVVETDRTVTLERVEPNGPDCPPTCAQERIEL